MTNPRKFSEKIALHSQKLAEETAAFEEIMREVGSAVTKTEPPSYSTAASPLAISPTQHSYLQPFHRGCGGSLPNVNQMLMHNQPIMGVGGVGESFMTGLSSADRRGGTEYDQRGSLVGPQRSPRSACEHRRETSPYSPSSVAAAAHLLTPPVECGWRRTHSDSALHQTLQQQQQQAYGAASELPANSSSPAYNCQQLQDAAGRSPTPHVSSMRRTADMSGSGDICSVPALFPHWAYSAHQSNSSAQLSSVYSGMCSLNGPVDGNSGSLPDLSSVNFPSPMAHPLDADGKMTPPYSTNRLCVPSTMISSSYLHGSRGSMMCASGSPGGSGSGAGSYSTQSPQQGRRSPRSPQHRTSPASSQPPPSPQQTPLSPESQHELLHVYRQPTVSPCPSPSFGQTGLDYRSPSPFADAPLSPAAPASPLGNGAAAAAGFYCTSPQTQQLQRQFEQFSMDMYCGASAQSTGLHSLSSGAVVCSSNPLSPGTPTSSIPEITLSDFSSATEAAALDTPELLRDLRDATDILQGGDDPFRDGDLGELDLEGLHMLTNPEGDLIDPNAEDCFRLESLAP